MVKKSQGWVQKFLSKPRTCEYCGRRVNKSKKRDSEEWSWLCAKCRKPDNYGE